MNRWERYNDQTKEVLRKTIKQNKKTSSVLGGEKIGDIQSNL